MLTQLNIKRLKSIESMEIDFAPLTIFTGINSSGKSTSIQAIRMIQNAIEGKDPFLEGYGGFRALLHIPQIQKKSILEKNISISLHINANNVFTLTISSDDDITLTKPSEKALNSEEDMSDLHISYISAARLGPRPYLLKKSSIFDFHVGEFGELLYSCLKEYSDRQIHPTLLHDTHPGYTVKHNLNAWMQDIAATTKIDLEDTGENIDVSNLSISNFRPTNVGFGASYCLPIVLGILAASARQYTRKDRQKKRDTLLLIIENPEAHLHPKGQTRMGYFLALSALAGIQILIETHSDYIIDGVRLAIKEKAQGLKENSATIYYFEKDDQTTHPIKVSFDKEGRLSKWPSGFFDQSLINKTELM